MQEEGRMAKFPHDMNSTKSSNSIAAFRHAPENPVPLCLEEESRPEVQDFAVDRKEIKIRLADSEDHRNSASMLINRMYSWRGYVTSSQVPENPNLITLMASEDHHAVFGTISLSFDSPIGLLADETYREEINAFRSMGKKICEFTKLALNSEINSKEVLAALFHVAFIYAWYIRECSDLLIEVNPRHRRFYERSLGFKQRGEIRNNPRVNAPSVLLWLDLSHAEREIQKYGGSHTRSAPGRSLYPYFFSPNEVHGIAQRLLNLR